MPGALTTQSKLTLMRLLQVSGKVPSSLFSLKRAAFSCTKHACVIQGAALKSAMQGPMVIPSTGLEYSASSTTLSSDFRDAAVYASSTTEGNNMMSKPYSHGCGLRWWVCSTTLGESPSTCFGSSRDQTAALAPMCEHGTQHDVDTRT